MTRRSSEHPAEELLYEEGLILRSSKRRQQLLGCIGCRWLKAAAQGEDAKVYGYEVRMCTGLDGGVVYPILSGLADIGVMVREKEGTNPSAEGLPARVLYYPAASELGEAFWARLQLPSVCPLEQDI